MTDPTISGDNPATTMLKTLLERDPAEAHALARDMIAAATALLDERCGSAHALDFLRRAGEIVQAQGRGASVAAAAPRPACQVDLTPADQAFAALKMLRAMPRAEAHERARAVVAGAGAYLYETFGDSYASAVLGETVQVAADHGAIMRGGRDTNVTLH